MKQVWLAVRDLVVANRGLKLLALALAVLIQIAVQKDSVREAEVAIPLQLTGLARDQVFTGALPEKALVRVRGRWTSIRSLLADQDAKLLVDVSSYKSGERHIFEQRSVEQQLPVDNVEVVSVQPAALDIRMEPLEEREVPVEPVVQGEPASGFRAQTKLAEATPATVRISGPASAVRRIGHVRTAPVDVTGADGDVRLAVRLLPPAERATRLAVEEVTVTVPLQELELSKTVAGVPIAIRGCPDASRCLLDPAEAGLRIEGPAKAVLAFLAEPPPGAVVADVQAAVQRGDKTVRLTTIAAKGLVLTPQPSVARLTILGESPAPSGSLDPAADADGGDDAPSAHPPAR